MAPSASKQKRLAEKAAKQSAKVKAGGADASTTTGTSTPTGSGSVNGSTAGTPLTNTSAATSQEDLSAMAKLQIATDRCVLSWTREMVCVLCLLTSYPGDYAGVLRGYSSLTLRAAISKSTRTHCHSMGGCS